jgi:hypothetical protein
MGSTLFYQLLSNVLLRKAQISTDQHGSARYWCITILPVKMSVLWDVMPCSSVSIHHTTRRLNPENWNIDLQCCENPKWHTVKRFMTSCWRLGATRLSARTHTLHDESHVQIAPAGISPFSFELCSVPDKGGTDSLQHIEYQFHFLTGFHQRKIF